MGIKKEVQKEAKNSGKKFSEKRKVKKSRQKKKVKWKKHTKFKMLEWHKK